jgi:hypothetical protein
MEIVTSWSETAMQNLILRQLNCRVGPLETAIEQRVRSLSVDRIESLSDAIFDLSDRAQLLQWLEKNNA